MNEMKCNQDKCVNDLVSHFKKAMKYHRVSNIILGGTLVLYLTLVGIILWG